MFKNFIIKIVGLVIVCMGLAIFFHKPQEINTGAGIDSIDVVTCDPVEKTQVRFERHTDLGITYKDAFNFTPSECDAYNAMSAEERADLQWTRFQNWLDSQTAKNSAVGEGVLEELDPQI